MAEKVDHGRLEPPGTTDELARRWSVYQPWLQRDPVTPWIRMRDSSPPIVRSGELGGFWILTRYEDIEWAAKNPEIFSSAQIGIPHRDIFETKQIPIQLDGDEHRMWRQTLSVLFNPSVVNHFAPLIREATVEAIERVVPKGRCEFIEEIAVTLPAETFLITFGIGREYLQPLLDHKTWLRKEGIPNARTDADIHAANKPLWNFFRDALARRRAEGTAGRMDVFSRLIETSFDDRPLTEDEMVNAAFVSMLAALDTTTAALGLAFLHLAGHPDVQDQVVSAPGNVPAIVEELIRHEPVSTTGRVVTRDVERHGVTMRAGDRVLMSWGMSGRDPEVFARPDEVDFGRDSTRHLGFGIGPHRCLGMHVARRIMRTAVEEWHARVPRYRVADGSTPVHHYSPARGIASLELEWES